MLCNNRLKFIKKKKYDLFIIDRKNLSLRKFAIDFIYRIDGKKTIIN